MSSLNADRTNSLNLDQSFVSSAGGPSLNNSFVQGGELNVLFNFAGPGGAGGFGGPGAGPAQLGPLSGNPTNITQQQHNALSLLDTLSAGPKNSFGASPEFGCVDGRHSQQLESMPRASTITNASSNSWNGGTLQDLRVLNGGMNPTNDFTIGAQLLSHAINTQLAPSVSAHSALSGNPMLSRSSTTNIGHGGHGHGTHHLLSGGGGGGLMTTHREQQFLDPHNTNSLNNNLFPNSGQHVGALGNIGGGGGHPTQQGHQHQHHAGPPIPMMSPTLMGVGHQHPQPRDTISSLGCPRETLSSLPRLSMSPQSSYVSMPSMAGSCLPRTSTFQDRNPSFTMTEMEIGPNFGRPSGNSFNLLGQPPAPTSFGASALGGPLSAGGGGGPPPAMPRLPDTFPRSNFNVPLTVDQQGNRANYMSGGGPPPGSTSNTLQLPPNPLELPRTSGSSDISNSSGFLNSSGNYPTQSDQLNASMNSELNSSSIVNTSLTTAGEILGSQGLMPMGTLSSTNVEMAASMQHACLQQTLQNQDPGGKKNAKTVSFAEQRLASIASRGLSNCSSAGGGSSGSGAGLTGLWNQGGSTSLVGSFNHQTVLGMEVQRGLAWDGGPIPMINQQQGGRTSFLTGRM